jgi:glutamate/tyrosine decarboxylase-like PLP-dependent enzyme
MRAVPDEDVAAVFAHNERLRREGYGRMISVLADKRWLREDLDEQHATDVLLFVLSAESFRTLVTDYGWTVDTWRDWALETLAGQLLREP